MLTFELISATGYRVRFSSSDLEGKIEDYCYLLEAYLPGTKIISQTENQADLLICFQESNKRSLLVSDQEIIISDIWGGKISLDLWHLLYSIIRKDLLSRDLFSVHATCAGKEKMVLLVGHSGMGKTTVMLKMVNDFSWKIFSGNKTLVDFRDGLTAVAGTETISIKESDLPKYPKLKQTAATYSNRTALFLDKEHYEKRERVPINAVCLIKVDDGNQQAIELTYPSNMHALYPFFLDTVNADTIVCDGEAVYSGETPLFVKERLARRLKRVLSTVKVFNLSGPVEYLAEQIRSFA